MTPAQAIQVRERADIIKKAIREQGAMAIRAAEGGTLPSAEVIKLNGVVKTIKPGFVGFFWRGVRKFTLDLKTGELTVPK